MLPATIIIPAHNRRDTTVGCLRALQANGDLAACEVLVVDDGSTDGTADAIAAEFPPVTVLAGNGSLYWTGAIRLAMEHLASIGAARHVIWLNDDVRPAPGSLARLRAWLDANPDALAAPTAVDPSGRRVATGFVGRRRIVASAGAVARVDGLSGFCVGLGATAWPSLGLPDADRFPHYGGDTAYTLHATRQGHRVVLLGDATCTLLDEPSRSDSPAQRVRAGESLRQNARRLFADTASPFRLRTMRALLRLKYGAVVGTLLGAARTVVWSAAVVRAKWFAQ